jgi:hypothetical protein
MRRLAAAGVTIDAKYHETAREFLTHDLAHRVTRIAFGEEAAKARTLSDDQPLVRAIELLQRSTTQAQLLATVSSTRQQ